MDEGLGALLQWAAKRGKLAFSTVTLTYHHESVETLLTHHGLKERVPIVLHPVAPRYCPRRLQRDTKSFTWAAGLPCTELVLVDVFATGGHVAQRLTDDAYAGRACE